MAPRRENNRNNSRTATGRLVESCKKKRLLVCGGHTYRVNQKRQAANRINWRCVKQSICNGTASSAYYNLETVPVDTQVTITLGKEHLHEPDDAEIQVQDVMRALRTRAASEPNEPPSRLVQGIINEVQDEEVLMRLPERQTMLRGYL